MSLVLLSAVMGISLSLIPHLVVNPDREDGKVTLITRYGAGKVRSRSQCRATIYLLTRLRLRWRNIFPAISVQ